MSGSTGSGGVPGSDDVSFLSAGAPPPVSDAPQTVTAQLLVGESEPYGTDSDSVEDARKAMLARFQTPLWR